MTAINLKFGWSYPPGCEGPPDETWPEAPRCEKCGAFLRHDPDARTEDVWEDTDLARDRTCVPKDAYKSGRPRILAKSMRFSGQICCLSGAAVSVAR